MPTSTDCRIAVAYLRVSTEDQTLGPEAQRASIERWAASQGVQVAAWEVDAGVGGATPVESRAGLLRALGALRTHHAGVLVAAKRDRIARDVVIAATVERLALDAGARVVTADGVSAEDSPEGKLMRTLMDAFAAYERALIRARTRQALGVKKARGERVSRFAPLGYRFEGGRTVPDDHEQALLCRVRDMRARRLSFQRVADLLEKEGVRIRGSKINPGSLARCLRRESAA